MCFPDSFRWAPLGKLLATAGIESRTLFGERLAFYDHLIHSEFAMITEAIVAAPPVLAAGWSLLYLLFGGGLGGAVLIFFGLKLIGR